MIVRAWYEKRSVGEKQALLAWVFLAVPLFFFVVVRLFPTLYTAGVSFTEWNLLKPKEFVGFANYTRLWNDPVFWTVFANTFKYLLIGMPISILLSFAIAYYLDQIRFMHGFIRAMYFIPFLTTAAAMAWVWRWFYQPIPVGIFNLMLVDLGFSQQPFLRSTSQALGSVLAPAIWAGLGFQIVIFLAGLRAIPDTYYEAARIDGVGRLATLTRITLPLLRSTFIFLVVVSSIAFLRIFDKVYNMTVDGKGGPLNATRPLVLNIYGSAFTDFQMGYAAAQTMVLFVVLLLVTLVQLRLMKAR
jgi:multiple sugar transport system permease protein